MVTSNTTTANIMACLNVKDETFSHDVGFSFKGLQYVMNGTHIGKVIG